MKEEAKRAIGSYIKEHGGDYPKWYCGIATDPEERLYEEHNVHRWGIRIHRDAGSESAAREVEKHFLAKGCKGGTGGGKNPHYVYAYKITSTTRP